MVLAMFIQAIDCEYCVDYLFPFHPVSVPPSAKVLLPDIQDPYPEISRGCTLIGVNRLIFLNWVVFTIVEGGTPCIT